MLAERAQQAGRCCRPVHGGGKLQSINLQFVTPAFGGQPGIARRLSGAVDDHVQAPRQNRCKGAAAAHERIVPTGDQVAPKALRRFMPDQAGAARHGIQRHHLRDISKRGKTQAIRLIDTLRLRRNCRNRDRAATIQVQYIFIAELPVEIGDARNRLHQVPFGGAAGVDHFEQRTNQAAVAVVGVRRYHFRLSHIERNPTVTPAQTPEAGVGDHRMVRIVGIFHKRKIVRPHVGKALTHQHSGHICCAAVEGLICPIPMDHAHEPGDFLLVTGGGPATNQAIAKIANVGRFSAQIGHGPVFLST